MATYSKLPSGKWRVQIRRQGFYRAATFPLKKDARAWAEQIEAQVLQASTGQLVRPKGLTVGVLIEKFREIVPQKGRTQQSCLDRLKDRIGDKSSDNLPIVLRDFIDSRVKDGAGGVTIAQDLSYLSTVLKWARYDRRIDVDPDAALEARRNLPYRNLNTRSASRERLPTKEEMNKLYELWENNPRQTVPMKELCEFARASGFRQGEICKIRIEDVDAERKTVIIRQRKDPRNKQDNDQIVPLVGKAWEMVEERIKDKTSGRIFPYNSDSVSAAFTRGCQKCNIKDLRFHDLRHEATVSLFRMGLDIPRVSLITGHKEWKNLKRYTNLQPEDVHSALSKETDGE